MTPLALLAAAFLAAEPAGQPQRPPQAAAAPKPHPCRLQLEALRPAPGPGGGDPGPLLAAADCLRREDSARGTTPSGHPPDPRLVAALPDNKNWYYQRLERFIDARDAARALSLAWLAEAWMTAPRPRGEGPGQAPRLPEPEPQLWREIAEAHALAGDVRRAALAYVRQNESDTNQIGYIQFQVESLLRSAGSETPPARFLDTLIAEVPKSAAAFRLLESLCWSYRHPSGAYRSFKALLALRDPGPDAVLDKAGRFLSLGHWDFAAGILDAYPWRKARTPWPVAGRSLFLRSHYHLGNWDRIAAEAGAAKGLGDEDEYVVASALTQLGRAQESLGRLQRLEAKAEPPWNYRARLMKARALLALKQYPEAAAALDALKKDPHRKESTGPILFWQAFLALQQSRFHAAESLLVLASAYTGNEEAQRALEYRFFLLLDTLPANRAPFFRGLEEAPQAPRERAGALGRVPEASALWPYARLEKAQIMVSLGHDDSARALLEEAAKRSPDRLAAFAAEARAAFLQEKTPEGRRAALARYEDLLVEYQQGVVPEFSRGRIRALKQKNEESEASR